MIVCSAVVDQPAPWVVMLAAPVGTRERAQRTYLYTHTARCARDAREVGEVGCLWSYMYRGCETDYVSSIERNGKILQELASEPELIVDEKSRSSTMVFYLCECTSSRGDFLRSAPARSDAARSLCCLCRARSRALRARFVCAITLCWQPCSHSVVALRATER